MMSAYERMFTVDCLLYRIVSSFYEILNMSSCPLSHQPPVHVKIMMALIAVYRQFEVVGNASLTYNYVMNSTITV